MNKKVLLAKYIRSLKRRKLLTQFIAFIFDYEDFHDYNYIFRISEEKSRVIIDIYDNISNNRFNRYIFNYQKNYIKTNIIKVNNIYVTYINVNSIKNTDKKLYKLAYLFKLDKKEMLKYANTFLKKEYVEVLKDIIK